MGRDVRRSRAFRHTRRYKEATAELGRNVRWWRKDKRWTLEKAAERMGLDLRHLQQIEAGSVNVTLATILKICDAFEVAPFIILPRLPDPEAEPLPGIGRTLRVLAVRADDSTSHARHPGQLMANPIPRPLPVEKEAVQKRVGSAVKRYRQVKGWTQAKLAKLLGCAVQHVQEVEGGRENLSIESLVKFSKVLDIDPRHLFESG